MRKKSEKTESFSELLRAGRIRVRVPRRGAALGLGGLLALFCGAGALLLLAVGVQPPAVRSCGGAGL